MTIEDPSLSALGYQLFPLATSQLVDDNRNLMLETYFKVFHSLLVGHNFRTLEIHHWLPLV